MNNINKQISADKSNSRLPIKTIVPKEIPLMNKIDKKIEIVTIPRLADLTVNHPNIGIEINEFLIKEILCSIYRKVIITEINSHSDLNELVSRRPDLVFSGVKYFDFDGQQLWLNDYLDQHDIPYIASSRKALDSEFDKSNAKNMMQESGVKTALYFTAVPGQHQTESDIPLEFPLFVKPVSGGDSEGVDANSVVNNFKDFQRKVADIWSIQHSGALVETYLSGKEYSVGIFEDHFTGVLTAMPVEIIAQKNKNGHRILDYDVKRFDHEEVIGVSTPAVHQQLSALAKAAFKVLGGKGFGRIDIKMDGNKIPYFMEANLMPGLGKGYFYRSCVINLAVTYKEMILKIAANGLTTRS